MRIRGLLEAPSPSLADHVHEHGPLPRVDLTVLAERAELTGRGGAGFPTARKLRAVADAGRATRRSPIVVGNGGEGEPAAHKDATLLARAPHLVLDGLQLAAAAVGAEDIVLAAGAALLPGLTGHLAQRRDRVPVRLHSVADRFLAGEESALVAAVDGGSPLPRVKTPPVWQRGVAGSPTLVANVETLARLALLARGDATVAGRTLVTRHADVVDVTEIELGARLGDVLPVEADVQAVLIGGYHGSWVPATRAADARLDRDGLAAVGAALGAGVLATLPADRCGLAETARVVGYLATQSAGQCGPCLNGLPRIAAALQVLARPGGQPPDRRTALLEDVARWCGLVAGRGACSHPDGSVRLVTSALAVFDPELAAHRAGWCTAAVQRPFLPVPGSPPVPGSLPVPGSRT